MKYNQKLYEKVNEKYQNIATSQLSDQAFCKEVEKILLLVKGKKKKYGKVYILVRYLKVFQEDIPTII